jgi:hypothetical protein
MIATAQVDVLRRDVVVRVVGRVAGRGEVVEGRIGAASGLTASEYAHDHHRGYTGEEYSQKWIHAARLLVVVMIADTIESRAKIA